MEILKEALQNVPKDQLDQVVKDWEDSGATVVKVEQSDGKWTVTAVSLGAEETSPEAPWLDVAKKELGVSEVEGAKHNERILEYNKTTSLSATDDETSWCSSFVNWCMKQAGIQGTGSARARSWLEWGTELDEPRPGCIVVFSRPPDPASGHVVFFLSAEGDSLTVLGGNQGDAVSTADYPKSRKIEYRWPA